MPSASKTVRPFLLHALVWAGFAIYEQTVLLITAPRHFSLLLVSLYYLLNILLFYANSDLLLPRLAARRRYWAYAGATLGMLALYACLRSELILRLQPVLLASPVPSDTAWSYGQVWLLAGYRGSFFLFVSLGYWFARRAVALEVQKREQEHQLRTAERSLMEANLAFLKNQINPHFLFNSLNFLYAQVYPHSEPSARGILLLSDIMRYALAEDINGKVMLTQEIDHLRNYIALNQLRFNNQLQVDFQVAGNLQFSLILPLVLITFVENCFKHGELGDATHPLVISLAVVLNQLTFRTHNKKRTGPKEKSTGIGLDNTRQRLDIVYPGRYTLVINDGADDYTCTLTLAL